MRTQKGSFNRLKITLSGNNSLGLKQELQKLVENYSQEYGEDAVAKLDGEEIDFNQLMSVLRATSLFSQANVVIVKNCGLNKALREELTDKFSDIPEDTIVIFYEPNPDKRSSFYKKLKKDTEFKELNSLQGNELIEWVVEVAKKNHAIIDKGAANLLVNMLGDDQWRINSEIEKLALHNKKIDAKSIRELVEGNVSETIFELLDKAFSGNKKESINTYRNLRLAKMEPQYIMGMIAWQINNLVKVMILKEAKSQNIPAEGKMSPFVVQKCLRVVNKLTKKQLRDMVERAAEADFIMKQSSVNPDNVIENLIISI